MQSPSGRMCEKTAILLCERSFATKLVYISERYSCKGRYLGLTPNNALH